MIERECRDNREKSVYVLLTDTGTWFTTMIKRFTSAPYNHASLALDAGLEGVYSFGRKNPANPFSGGFVEEDVYGGTYSRFPDTRCMLLRLRLTQDQHQEARRVVETFKDQRERYSYNLIGLLGVLIDRGLGSDTSYFCSQFVAEALRAAGLALWERPSALVTPEHFRAHAAFETVYEGRLYDYPLLDRGRLPIEFETEAEPAMEWAVL